MLVTGLTMDQLILGQELKKCKDTMYSNQWDLMPLVYQLKTLLLKLEFIHEDSTEKNIKTMEKQLKAMGAMFNWENEVVTCTPEYYKWTQWIFLKLYEKGLAYRKKAPVNWCPSCNTVLANEQVLDGACERCSTEVTKKDLTQWFFKITDYADELLEKLDTLDWPEKTSCYAKTLDR